jgi:hypothetical protein
MKYTIDDKGRCEAPIQTNVSIVGDQLTIKFSDGSEKSGTLPSPDYTAEFSGKAEVEHTHTIEDIVGFDPTAYATSSQGAKADSAIQQADMESYISSLDIPTNTQQQTTNTNLTNHTSDTNNPHGVTKSQVGLGNVDNTSDANKPVSTPQKQEIDNKYNAAISYINSKISVKVDKVTGSRLMTNAEGDKIAEFDDKHYKKPVDNLVELSNLSEGGLYDKERRFVASEGKDYFYDSDAVVGDLAPTNQTGGTGFWKTVTVDSGSDYTKWILRTEGTFRKNMSNETILDLKASGLLSVDYSAEGVVTYSTEATKNDTDANLRDRSTHTGEQPISSITGLREELDDKVQTTDQNTMDNMLTNATWTENVLYVIPCGS